MDLDMPVTSSPWQAYSVLIDMSVGLQRSRNTRADIRPVSGVPTFVQVPPLLSERNTPLSLLAMKSVFSSKGE